ncbi:MAG: PhzF family phenazine biosynthesis protein [SAR202 cluster bacterium]|nr:PhzF family phenazine biosynthesis protein [SAR202 cluster bacterium]
MVKEYEFRQVDVFTTTPNAGNPLAVVMDAQGLSTGEMQAIAVEMNLSETSFVLPPERPGADYRMRIFTPKLELPFAGHPSVGTAYILFEEGRFGKAAGPITVRQQVAIGVLPIEIRSSPGGPPLVMMTQGKPEFWPRFEDLGRLAAALGLRTDDIRRSGLTPQVASTGLKQMVVPVASLEAVTAMKPDMRVLAELETALDVTGLEVFCLQTRSGVTAHVRFFGPASGVAEDPATGSAAGGLGAYLVKHEAVDVSRSPVHITIEQGEELKRPSRIEVEVDHQKGEPRAVRDGGTCVTVFKGKLPS